MLKKINYIFVIKIVPLDPLKINKIDMDNNILYICKFLTPLFFLCAHLKKHFSKNISIKKCLKNYLHFYNKNSSIRPFKNNQNNNILYISS